MKNIIIYSFIFILILSACSSTPNKETPKAKVEVTETKVESKPIVVEPKPVAIEEKTEVKETKTVIVETKDEIKPFVSESKTEVKPVVTETKAEVKAVVVPSYIELLPKNATKFIKDNPTLIILDVSSSFSKGHLKNAINFPIKDGSFDKVFKKWNKNKIYLICSDSDDTALSASKKLATEGFKKIYILKGNLKEWTSAKLSIEKSK